MDSGAMIYIPRFVDFFCHSKVLVGVGERRNYTNTQQGD
jgi:hypothetical protein